MKKLLIILMCLLLIPLTACNAKTNTENKGSLHEVLASDLTTKFENKETFVFFVGQTTCSNCKEFLATLEKYIVNHQLDMIYVEADGEDNVDTFDTLLETYFPDIEYTPTTYYVEDGVIKDSVVGTMDADQLDLWGKRLGLEF